MPKLKKELEINQEDSDTDQSEDVNEESKDADEESEDVDEESEDEDEESDDIQYDSMIENGTSDNESENETAENNSSDEQTDEENHDSGQGETKVDASRKRKQSMQSAQPDNSKKSKEDKKLFKQPTVEEINQLRETENLYHSNLFRMQIEEMLKEVRVKEKYNSFAIQWLEEFNAFLGLLKSMPEKEDVTNLTFLRKCKVQVPLLTEELYSSKYQFQFLTPHEKAFLVGSAATNTWLGSKLVADICVPIPAKCFQKENYLNLIYDQKRALYITYIANQMLKKKFHSSDLKFNIVHNNPYRPVLEIVPDGQIGKKLTFRIHVAADEEAFKLNRFVPWNSNIRDSSAKVTEEASVATPNYNATVLFDLTMKDNQKVICETIGTHKNLQEGIILLKVWLRQRCLETEFLGFGNYLMTLLVVYLFKERKIHTSMSSYQVARNVWNQLASSSWNTSGKGITLCTTCDQPNQPTLEQFHAHYDVVFVDSTGYLNLCSNLSLDMYLTLKYESQRAMDLLNNIQLNSFQALFMDSIPLYTKFDHFLKFYNEAVIDEVLKEFGKTSDYLSYAGMWYPQFVKMICSIIRKGLEDRILSLTVVEDQSEPWPIVNNVTKQVKSVKLGLVLNRETACEVLNKGPQANDPKSAEFRDFWGDRSQLRRFQDGSITEACVWATATATATEKRLVVKQIVQHLLYHHFKIHKKQIDYIAHQFDVAYSLDRLFFVFELGKEDAENTSLNVIKKFDEIGKKLRSCDDLPLDITSVQGISSVFRYCDPVPILNNAKYYEEAGQLIFQSYKVCHGVIQLGISGKWPNDLPAFRRIKTAFHIQIARTLREKFKLVTRGDVNGVCILNDGYLFKVEIFHQKELALMKKTVSTKGVMQYTDTPESLELEKRLDVLPKITSFLHGLYQRCTTFGPTVMIAKRWLYSQLLDSFLWPDECTELLVAHQFLKEGSCTNPLQPQTGFFRFLEFMANFDFRNEMVLLNFNDEINHDDITDLETKFNADRQNYPPLAIITSFDNNRDCIWSKEAPTPQILARVVLLAKFALKQIEPAYRSEIKMPMGQLFIASLDGYDLIITLSPYLVRSCHTHDFEPVPGSGHRIDATIPAAEFDPVRKGLHELRNSYSEFALFFYNPCGGRHIAVIWKPECFVEREFKIGDVNGCFVDKDGIVRFHIEKLIDDFKITLKGLYSNFTDLREKRIKDNC